jgi:hypothetical protein
VTFLETSERLLDLLDNLSVVYAEDPCIDIIQSALSRFHSTAPGKGFADGGSSTTVWGYIISTRPETTYITNLGRTDLGPTVIHEEAHHRGVTSETYAEALGQSCGQEV